MTTNINIFKGAKLPIIYAIVFIAIICIIIIWYNYMRRAVNSIAASSALFARNERNKPLTDVAADALANPYMDFRQHIFWEQSLDKSLQQKFCRRLVLQSNFKDIGCDGATNVDYAAYPKLDNRQDFPVYYDSPETLSILYKALILQAPAGFDMGQIKHYCLQTAKYQKESGAVPEFLYNNGLDANYTEEPAAAAAFVMAVANFIHYSGESDFLLQRVQNNKQNIYGCCIAALNYCRNNTNAYGLISAARGGFFDYMIGADSYSDIFATLYYIAALKKFITFFEQPENVRAAAKTITMLSSNIKQKLKLQKDDIPQLTINSYGDAVRGICILFSNWLTNIGPYALQGREELLRGYIKFIIDGDKGAAAMMCIMLMHCCDVPIGLNVVTRGIDMDKLTCIKEVYPLYQAVMLQTNSGFSFKLGKIFIKEQHRQTVDMRFCYGGCDVNIVVGDKMCVTVDGVRLGVGRYFSLGKNARRAEVVLPRGED